MVTLITVPQEAVPLLEAEYTRLLATLHEEYEHQQPNTEVFAMILLHLSVTICHQAGWSTEELLAVTLDLATKVRGHDKVVG